MAVSNFPTVTVEVAFGQTPTDTSLTWTDISAYHRTIEVRRGRWSEQSQTYDAGVMTLVLKNADRRFDPLYTSGAYYPNLVPMAQIRVRATYNAVTYGVFRGFVDEWRQDWDPHLKTYSECTVTATDAFGFFATFELPDRYAMEVLTDDPVGFWRMNDSGNYLSDSSTNGWHGSWSGNTAQSDTSALSGAGIGGSNRHLETYSALDVGEEYWFDGSLGAVQNVDTSTAAATLECWIYVDAFSSGVLEFKGSTGPTLMGLGMRTFPILFEEEGCLAAQLDDGAGEDRVVPMFVPFGQWNHIVLVWNGTSFSEWLNGVECDAYQVTNEGAAWQFSTGLGLSLVNTGYHVAGVEVGGDWFVDEVALYDGALSEARIKAHYLAGKQGFRTERAGDRIDAVLDFLEWPSARRAISDGDSWLEAGPTEAVNALAYLQAIAATDDARLFVNDDGDVVFRDRTWAIETSSANTSQGSFGDSGSELRYQRLVLDGGHVESLRNDITVTTPTAGTGRGIDQTSVDSYGRRPESISSLHTNPGDAANLASWRVDRYKDPTLNFTELEFNPRRDPTNLFPQALARSIGHRVTVNRRPQSVGSAISQERAIEGIAHVITPENWVTTWYLVEPVATAAEGGWWVVGTDQVGTAVLPY